MLLAETDAKDKIGCQFSHKCASEHKYGYTGIAEQEHNDRCARRAHDQWVGIWAKTSGDALLWVNQVQGHDKTWW